MPENQLEPERAFLVGVSLKGSRPLLNIQDSLEELVLLARTAGMQIVGTASQNVTHIDSATFIGRGKVEEVREALVATNAQTIIFDDELSPRHQRELEKRFGEDMKVLDHPLILDILPSASTHEGALQVDGAYGIASRLTRQWTRPAGGGGGRGNGRGWLARSGNNSRPRDIRAALAAEDLQHVRMPSRHRAQRVRTVPTGCARRLH
jgi:GTP-binding protein HflX